MIEKFNRRNFLKTTLVSSVAISTLNSCSLEHFEAVEPNWKGKVIEIDLTNQMSDALYPTLVEGEVKNLPRSVLKFIGAGFTLKIEGVNFGIPLIITRIKNENKIDDFACYTSMCTHNNCLDIRPSIGQKDKNRHMVCPCHSSRFDAFDHGKVIEGPAEIPLKEFETEFNPSNNLLKIKF